MTKTEKRRIYGAKWYQEHKQSHALLNRAWKKQHPERAQAISRDSLRRRSTKVRKAMFEALGDRCACCHESIPQFLTLDHIKRDGAAERRLYGGNSRTLLDMANKVGWPKDRYRVLCMNCNWATRYGLPCPHQKN
jgi:hypothetical protein